MVLIRWYGRQKLDLPNKERKNSKIRNVFHVDMEEVYNLENPNGKEESPSGGKCRENKEMVQWKPKSYLARKNFNAQMRSSVMLISKSSKVAVVRVFWPANRFDCKLAIKSTAMTIITKPISEKKGDKFVLPLIDQTPSAVSKRLLSCLLRRMLSLASCK